MYAHGVRMGLYVAYVLPQSWNCDYYIGGRRGEAHTAISSSEHGRPSHAAWPLCTSYNGRRLV